MNDWIKTKDDFPDEMRPILFYVYDSYENACFVRYGRWLNGSYESYEENGNRHYDEDKVTHWMYAPTPPNMILSAPTVEIAKHGKWDEEEDGDGTDYCNMIKCIYPEHFNYCPNCGAKMDLE